MNHNMFEFKMKNFPVITTSALGEMVLYHDTIVINKVSEDTIDSTVVKLKEAFPFVKHFIYVDGIFFRRYETSMSEIDHPDDVGGVPELTGVKKIVRRHSTMGIIDPNSCTSLPFK